MGAELLSSPIYVKDHIAVLKDAMTLNCLTVWSSYGPSEILIISSFSVAFFDVLLISQLKMKGYSLSSCI